MGGTFDPIHHGHLVAAEEARAAFRLDRVIFMPAGAPWMKADRTVSEGRHRLRMTELAIEDNEGFDVSTMELDRPGPTRTVDTLRDLNADDLHFITGADALLDLPAWGEPEEILELATFVAATRPGYDTSGAAFAEHPKVRILPVPALAISSSDIRERVGADRPIRYLVPEAVRDYIRAERLYR